jgi:transketolase
MGHHGIAVPQDKLEAVITELDERALEFGVVNLDPDAYAEAVRIPPAPPPAKKTARTNPIGFDAAVAAEPKVALALAEKHMMSPRRAFGLALKGAW